jgi:SAM-dependent methyltransferase
MPPDHRELYDALYAKDDLKVFMTGLREHVDRFDAVMHIVQPLQAETILDIGCNHGLFGFALSGPTFATKRLVGVDFSTVALKNAVEISGYHETRCLDVTKPFDLQRKFALVLCMEVLEHVKLPSAVVENVYNHCGQYALFSTPREEGPVDGEIHVDKVFMQDLVELVRPRFHILKAVFVESHFCEKPKWQGWNLVLGRPI